MFKFNLNLLDQGIDDMQVDWISTWYFSSESSQILKDKIKSKSFDWFKETRGKKNQEIPC